MKLVKHFFILLTISTILWSCKNKEPEQKKQKTNTNQVFDNDKEAFTILKPKNYDTVTIAGTLAFSILANDYSKKIDSVNLYLNGKLVQAGLKEKFSWSVHPEKVGNNTLSMEVYLSGGIKQRANLNLYFLSNTEPESIKYKVISTYPHSTDNFTEGLVYHEKFLYEGTGDWGKSAICKVDLQTGEIIKSTFLPSNIFGEGITILNNKIIQLTYKSKEGYVFDKQSLSLLKKFSYSIPIEGWGLTTDGRDLIMSNGTDKLYVMDSTYYSIIREIQVCDDKEPLDSINELEYVNGIVYANIWMDNRIAKIEYESGKVLGYIDLSEIIPVQYRGHRSNVLNGVALNPKNGNLFVTGKKWDKLFEIKVE